MKYIIKAVALIALFSINNLHAQLRQITIGVNGLTCSQCSKSVYNKLKQLDFVKVIDMDLNHHIAIVQMKDANNYDIDKLAEAIDNAGYSVRNITLEFDKSGLKFEKQMFWSGKNTFNFSSMEKNDIPQVFSAILIGKKYNSDKKMNKLLPESFSNYLNNNFFVVIK